MTPLQDIKITRDNYVALVEMCHPPHNFVDVDFLRCLADALEELDADTQCRAVMLSSGVRAFCAGADFSNAADTAEALDPSPVYRQAMRLFEGKKPIVAAVQGAAIGAGLGLALVADFRITCSEARFSASFTRIGIHPGFGLSLTLPHLIGKQQAALLLYTGRRINGEEAVRIGLADELVAQLEVKERALALAHEIAASAPLAIETTRATLRQGFAQRVTQANQREIAIQLEQFRTSDFGEGAAAMEARRQPIFQRR